jgi:hypothetical protein
MSKSAEKAARMLQRDADAVEDDGVAVVVGASSSRSFRVQLDVSSSSSSSFRDAANSLTLAWPLRKRATAPLNLRKAVVCWGQLSLQCRTRLSIEGKVAEASARSFNANTSLRMSGNRRIALTLS